MPFGGANQGGDNVGAGQQGGANTGGGNAGGSNAGGSNAGGDNAGGSNAGGDNAGGDNAGGGASFQDCEAAATEFVAAYTACDIDVKSTPGDFCTQADFYDSVVCMAECVEGAPCEALNGEDPVAEEFYADCLFACK